MLLLDKLKSGSIIGKLTVAVNRKKKKIVGFASCKLFSVLIIMKDVFALTLF